MQLKRTFLLGVIGSLSLAAILGIWAFLFGNFGDTEFKIIMTTLTAAPFSLTSLGAAVVLERGCWRIAMVSTFVLSALGLVLYLVTIWVELWRYVDDDTLVKVMVWLATWAVALPHMGLISLASLKGFYLWARRAALGAVLLLALSITIFVLLEGKPDEDFWVRVIGIFGILTSLGTIAVPILAKVAGIEKEAGAESTSMEIKITCPRCLIEQTVRSGHSRCSGCKLKFEINIEEPRCPKCDYLLHKLTEPTCPECGQALGEDEITRGPGALDPKSHTMAEKTESTKAKGDSGTKRPKRRWLRMLFVLALSLVMLLVVLAVLAPMLISSDSGRQYVLGKVSEGIAGRVEADSLSLRWGKGQSVAGVAVTDASGTRIASLGRVDLPDASLWSIVQGGLALGQVEIESVTGDIIGYDDGTTNLSCGRSPNTAPKTSGRATSSKTGPKAPTAPAGSSPTTPPTQGRNATTVWPSGLSLGITLRDVDVIYRADGASAPVRLVMPEAKVSALDPKHMVLELDAELSQGGRVGSATADIRIDDLFDASGVARPDGATVEVDAGLNNLPVEALDQLAGQKGFLLALLGPILNGEIEAELTTTGGFARVRAESEHLYFTRKLDFDKTGLVSDGTGEAHLTMTPRAWAALNASENDEPTSTLLEPVNIDLDLKRLKLPWNKQGLALNDVGFDFGLTLSDVRMKVQGLGEVRLTTKSVGLVSDKLAESVIIVLDAEIEYPDSNIENERIGSIRSTTTLAGLRFTPGGLDKSQVTYTTDTHILRAPIDMIDTLAKQDGELVGALGPRARVDAVGSYTPGSPGASDEVTSYIGSATGGIDLLLKSRTAEIDAKLLIADGRWTLKADAPLSFQVTPRLSQTVLKKVNPFLGVVSAKLPISVNVRQEGFSAPVQDVGLADINADVLLELGELDLKSDGVLLKLLQQLGVNNRSLLNASFSPVTISLAGGMLSYKDLAMTVDQVSLSFSGIVDLNTEQLNLSLSIPGDSLAGISWLKGVIRADQVIVIPLTGTFDKPVLDFKLLTKEIGKAALEGQLGGEAGGAIRDKIGGDAEVIIGGLLDDLLKGEQPDTPPDVKEDAPDSSPPQDDKQAQPQTNEADKSALTPEERKARRKRRRERLEKLQAEQEQSSTTDSAEDKANP